MRGWGRLILKDEVDFACYLVEPAVLSRTNDHLESIPIFRQRLETDVVLRAEPSSLAF
jgi:hypothetical protein